MGDGTILKVEELRFKLQSRGVWAFLDRKLKLLNVCVVAPTNVQQKRGFAHVLVIVSGRGSCFFYFVTKNIAF